MQMMATVGLLVEDPGGASTMAIPLESTTRSLGRVAHSHKSNRPDVEPQRCRLAGRAGARHWGRDPLTGGRRCCLSHGFRFGAKIEHRAPSCLVTRHVENPIPCRTKGQHPQLGLPKALAERVCRTSVVQCAAPRTAEKVETDALREEMLVLGYRRL